MTETNIKDLIKLNATHYFYRIDNLINEKFYYGIRTCYCFPDQDPYMGSGCHLHRAYRKYGIENFKKTILKILPTREDASDLERWIVTEELVKDPMCYNQRVGGDDQDSFFGKVSCYDLLGNKSVLISSDVYYSNLDRYKCHSSFIENRVPVFDILNKSYIKISKEDYYANKGILYYSIGRKSGFTTFRNKETLEVERCSINDPRVKSGLLEGVTKGCKLSDEARHKISLANRLHTGKLNSMYGDSRIWINNGLSRKRVKPEELDYWLSKPEWHKGYGKGSKPKVHTHNPNSGNKGKRWIHKLDGSRKLINGTDLNSFLNNGEGWIEGYK